MTGKIKLQHIFYTGADRIAEGLRFNGKPGFVYGASNTGKSFALKSINFMLGGKVTDLPNIDERAPYDTAWLGLNLPKAGDVTLSRATKGGGVELRYEHTRTASGPQENIRMLGATHDDEDPDSLSRYLLDQIGFDSKRIAKNASGQTVSLSFRHLIRYCLVDETSIQATQPAIAGARPDEQLDRSIFRLLLTGQDDSAVKARLTPPQFKVSKQARLATMDDLIAEVDREIAQAQAALDDGIDRASTEDQLAALRDSIDAGRISVRDLAEKRTLVLSNRDNYRDRLNEVRAHLGRFRELDRLYTSDIERLESIEETGFLLNLGSERDCPLCGASPDHQRFSHGKEDVDAIRRASLAEITKIKGLRSALYPTIDDLANELSDLEVALGALNRELSQTEDEIAQIHTRLTTHESSLQTVLERRDSAQRLHRLQQQRADYIAKRDEYNKLKQSRREKIDLSAPDRAINDLCQLISAILAAWQFPGNRQVSFDHAVFDLRIDGKLRTDNGKGVRALTHAAFKLGMMQFCYERKLPHPGFIVLDSPLLTYRDAVRNTRHGQLSADERALAQTPVRDRFFEHLATLDAIGQIIIFDNIDPPSSSSLFADPVLFSGASVGRYGFFPVKPR